MKTEQLIVSVVVILLATRVLGWMIGHVGQPRVIGEMTAGILLGPSFLGRYSPKAFDYLFSSSSLSVLAVLSQLGLLLFMFVVGLEVDLRRLFRQKAGVVLISSFSILAPLLLGLALATRFYPEFAGRSIGFPSFALFMGTAMSITAFPVLARILKERNLVRTEVGTIAISCAAINDAIAWFLLAILAAMVRPSQSWIHLVLNLLSLVIFVVLMLFPVRHAALLLEKNYEKRGARFELFSLLVLIALGAGWITNLLGFHPLFGAFMAGLVMPKNEDTQQIAKRMEGFTLAFLLPLFFALAGVRTRIDLLTGRDSWVYVPTIILVATVGKVAGAAITSRVTGMKWRESLAVGVMMNTRGLVELVILNAGLELRILTTSLFTMMVIMALVTTFIAAPMLTAMNIVPNSGRQSSSA